MEAQYEMSFRGFKSWLAKKLGVTRQEVGKSFSKKQLSPVFAGQLFTLSGKEYTTKKMEDRVTMVIIDLQEMFIKERVEVGKNS